jgi:hypothetical protein
MLPQGRNELLSCGPDWGGRRVARCAGVVAWGPLVPRLYTSLMWAFHVPVGTATATPPFSARSTSSSTSSSILESRHGGRHQSLHTAFDMVDVRVG